MREDIKQSEIAEKTPLTTELWGRTIPNMMFYNPDYDLEKVPDYMEGEDWFLFIPGTDGELNVVKGEPYESTYFGKECEDPNRDIKITFLNLYYQYVSYREHLSVIEGIQQDIRNLMASISKLVVFQQLSNRDIGVQRMVTTELEYVFTVCRSLYDSLQYIASMTWDKLHLYEGGGNNLPRKFSDLVLHGDKPRTTDELMEKYGLLEGLAKYYHEEAEIFVKIRNFRDKIAHKGRTIKLIFVTEDGLAVDTERSPFSKFEVWSDDLVNENNIAPLWPFVSFIVDHTINSLERFVEGLLDNPIRMPPKLAPEYDLYMRGEHISNLQYLDSLMEDDPWGEQLTNHRLIDK